LREINRKYLDLESSTRYNIIDENGKYCDSNSIMLAFNVYHYNSFSTPECVTTYGSYQSVVDALNKLKSALENNNLAKTVN
jgi:hypothetical protein